MSTFCATRNTCNKPYFFQQSVEGGPFPVDLAQLQRKGYPTLEAYLDYCFYETSPSSRRSFVLPVTDTYFSPLILKVRSTDEQSLTGFWKSPFCAEPCVNKTTLHPCIDADSPSDRELFCLGYSPDDSDDEDGGSRDLNQQSLCAMDRRGKLTSCGIWTIHLHSQLRSTERVLVSVELFIGCSTQFQSTFVIQHHNGLECSLR